MLKKIQNALLVMETLALFGCGGGSGTSNFPKALVDKGVKIQVKGFDAGYSGLDEDAADLDFPNSRAKTVSFEEYSALQDKSDYALFMRVAPNQNDSSEKEKELKINDNGLNGLFIDVLPGIKIRPDEEQEKNTSPSLNAYLLHIEGAQEGEHDSSIQSLPVNTNNIYVGPMVRIDSSVNFIEKSVIEKPYHLEPFFLGAGIIKKGASADKGKPSPLNPTFNEIFRSNHDDGIFYFATGSHVKNTSANARNKLYLNGNIDVLLVDSGARIVLGREYYTTVGEMWHQADLTANLQLGFWPKEDRALMTVKEYSGPILFKKFITKLELVADNVLPNDDEFSLMVMQVTNNNTPKPSLKVRSSRFQKGNHIYTMTTTWDEAKKAVIANFKREPKTEKNSNNIPKVLSFKSIHEIAKKAALGLQNQLATSFNAMLTAGLHTTAQGVASAPGVSRLSLQHDGANVNTNGAVARFNVGGTNIMALGQAMTRHKATDGSGYGMALLAGKTLGENATQVTLFGGAQASMASGSKADDNMSVNLSEHRLDAVAGLSLRRSNAFYISAVGGVKLAATQNVNTQSMYMVDAPTFNTPTVFGALEASFNTTAGQLAASASTLGFNVGFKTGF